MSIADDATYEIPTETDVPCDKCEATSTVTVWDDIRTGRWEREAFTCRECDTHHPAVSGTSLDRGAAQVFVTVYASLAALFTIGLIGALGGHWPQGALMAPLIWVASVPFIIRLFMGAKQLRKDHS